MDLFVDDGSISETIDAFFKTVDTSDLAMLETLPFLDLLDDDADVVAAEGDNDEGGSEEGMTILPYTDSDDEEMDFKYKRCKGDCHDHLGDFYTTCSSQVVLRDTMMSAGGTSLRSENPLTMDSDGEEEVDYYEECLRASREMFAEWRDLEDDELDEYLGNVKRVKKQKRKVAEIASDNSDVDIEGISDESTDYSSDVDIENVNPGLFSEIGGVPKRHSPGSNVLGNSISLNFHNYAMCPQSVFRFTGKQDFTSKLTPSTASLEKPSTSAQKLALASLRTTPSTSRHSATSFKQPSKFTHNMASESSYCQFTSSQKPSTSSFMTSSSTSTQIQHVPAKRGRPCTKFGTAKRGRPPVSSDAGRRRSAKLVAAAIRRPNVVAEAIRNVPDCASPMKAEDFTIENGRKQDRLNMLERSRRRKLSDLLEELRLSVPSTAQLNKASKSQTLNGAIAHIGHLQTLERRQNNQIATETQKQKMLVVKLNTLKAQK